MRFEEVLDQAIAMLQSRGRLTYRMLKRHFQLDAEELEDLTLELIKGQRLAVDEDGEVLVWTEEVATPPEPVLTELATQEAQPTQAEPPTPTESPTPDAERRQLTVMFSDLVGSTPLAERLDPEDLREVVRAYQEVCAKAVSRYDGHIAKYMGDGLMAYFGYPTAHEDDAIRATHAGLGIIDGMSHLNANLGREKDFSLGVRVGIHTGLVVAGEMGSGQTREELAVVGETPNIASRLEGVAEPNTVVISSATHHLVEGYFLCQPLGPRTLKGVSQPVQVHRVIGESGAQSRLDIASARGLTPLVGSEQEVGLLLERWNQVKDRQGQVVLLSGEGGIGKSRLVQALKEHVIDEAHTRLECRSSPYHQNTALYPITDVLQRMLQFQVDDTPDEKLDKFARELSRYRLPLVESVPLFAPLLSLSIPEERYPPLNLSPHRQRQKTLESIVSILLELADQQPVLFILEDLHWTYPTTLELLDLLIDQAPTAAVCVLLTCRPAFQQPWGSRSYLAEVTVNRLSRDQIERMAERVASDKNLPTEVMQQIIEKTDGVPLFVEEMTKAMLESEVLKEVNGQYELVGTLSSLAIPSTLQDSLMARLDRLVTAKAVAQHAAVIGREFSFELLAAVSQLGEAMLQRELGRLVEAELLYQRGLPPQATYMFKHSLIQDTAYESLLKSTRRQDHQRIAQVLAEQFADTAKTQPELLAYHYTEAGCHEQAISYWQRAGQRAREGSAHGEAIAHLTRGLEILATLPQTPERDQQDLTFHVSLGNSLAVTRGWAAPEVEEVYTRALELCQQTGETSQLLPVLWGSSQVYFLRVDVPKHHDIGKRLLSLAQSQQDPVCMMAAHLVMGVNLFHTGDWTASLEHMGQAYKLHDPRQHRAQMSLFGIDLGVFALSYMAHTLWCLGYPEQALHKSHEAVTLAQKLSHPFSLTVAQAYAAMLSQFRQQKQATRKRAEATVALCERHRFAYYLAWGTIIKGWVGAENGEAEDGMAEMQQGISVLRATGSSLRLPYYRALLTAAFRETGNVAEGLRVLDEAFADVQQTGERWVEAELYRLKGELLLQYPSDNFAEVETCFPKALDIARQQQAKSWELRAANSLARLWQSQDKRQEAYAHISHMAEYPSE